MKVSLQWLREFVDLGERSNALIADTLTMSGLEVEACDVVGDDTVLTLNVTPNRPDALSMRGMARELCACLGVGLRAQLSVPLTQPSPQGGRGLALRVQLDAASACPRYAACVVQGVTVAPSPANIQARLTAVGIRPINNIVDATNYVMWETGNPLHAFDARFVKDAVIRVCEAASTGSMKTLDGVERALQPHDLLICDAAAPIALAGIMGGANSEIRSDTTNIILECAYFSPATVRRTSKRLGLMTESSRRFERGVDPNGVGAALARVAQLVCEWSAGATVQNHIDIYPAPILPCTISFPVALIARILGTAIPLPRACDILTRLGCLVDAGNDSAWNVSVPTTRPDLTRPIDLLEEIARVYGFENIPPQPMDIQPTALHRPAGHALWAQCRERLLATGFSESVSYAFESAAVSAQYSAAPVESFVALTNPLGGEPTVLKSSLVAGLVAATTHNVRHGRDAVRLFEKRRVFARAADGSVSEHQVLALIVHGRRHRLHWAANADGADFFDLKGAVEALCDWCGVRIESVTRDVPTYLHPGRAAAIIAQGEVVGWVGLLHPSLAAAAELTDAPVYAELHWDRLVALSPCAPRQYHGLCRFPGVRRDVAVLVDCATTAESVALAVRNLKEPALVAVTIFDVFAGPRLPPGKKSLAFAMQYQEQERTLTDDEVNAVHARVLARLQQIEGLTIR